MLEWVAANQMTSGMLLFEMKLVASHCTQAATRSSQSQSGVRLWWMISLAEKKTGRGSRVGTRSQVDQGLISRCDGEGEGEMEREKELRSSVEVMLRCKRSS